MNQKKVLDGILGQEIALTYLHRFLTNRDRTPGSIVLYGPDGVGKFSAAESFSRQFLCHNGTGCGICDSCKAFDKGFHPDYIIFPRTKNIGIGKEKEPEEFTIRWLLQTRIPYKPHLSEYKIILFPEANRILHEAETALLKTLEEPPSHTKFLLVVNDLHRLKPTILSRSVLVPFHYLPREKVTMLLGKESAEQRLYYGGSLNPFEMPDTYLEEWHNHIRENCHDSLLLLHLEAWIREQMNDIRSTKDGVSPIEFLEVISLLLIYEYRQRDFETNLPKIEAILEFKEKLHYEVPALEYLLLSKLFLKLCSISPASSS